MRTSQCIAIGRSFLPAIPPMTVDQLIDEAALAAQQNPEVAAEITLATTEAVLVRYGAQDSLRITMQSMVERLCTARDRSTVQ